MRFAVVAHAASETNLALAERGWPGAESTVVAPRNALRWLHPGDVALSRIDVLSTLNGVEDGLWIVNQLEAQGVRVLNPSSAVLAAHDKLLTARLLEGAGLPHPRTARIIAKRSFAQLRFPVVCKPRFGSWGRDVELVDDAEAYAAYCASLTLHPWWRAGAIVQELVPPVGHDLRIVVARGQVTGAATRRPGRGDWRTNVAGGGTSEPVRPPAAAVDLALRAVEVLGLDLAGVDLLPDGDDWVVLEVNAAVDFRPWYALDGDADVFATTLNALTLPFPARHRSATAA